MNVSVDVVVITLRFASLLCQLRQLRRNVRRVRSECSLLKVPFGKRETTFLFLLFTVIAPDDFYERVHGGACRLV